MNKPLAMITLMACTLLATACADTPTQPAATTPTSTEASAETQTPVQEELQETEPIETILETAEQIDGGDPDEAQVDAGDPDEVDGLDAQNGTTITPGTITTVAASSLEGTAGYEMYVCPENGNYEFKAMESEDITWMVYILDEEFNDGIRYLSQAYDPALEGDGTIEIKEGQYIYIYCSANGFTGEEAPANCQYFFQKK